MNIRTTVAFAAIFINFFAAMVYSDNPFLTWKTSLVSLLAFVFVIIQGLFIVDGDKKEQPKCIQPKRRRAFDYVKDLKGAK